MLVIMVSSCSIYNNISATVDVSTDFTKYKSFAWLPDQTDSTNLPYNNEIIRNNIRNYFGQSFSERGYTVNLDSPDVLLKVIIGTKPMEKVIVNSTGPSPYYYKRYYYGSRYYYPYKFDYYYHYPRYYRYESHTIEYIQGSITLNVIDRKLNKLVWSGTAKGDIYDPSYINENIHPAVIAIMKKYPVAPLYNH